MRYLYISLFLSAFAIKANAQIITTVAGNGTNGYSGDGGQAAVAELFRPTGIVFDAVGNLYFADEGNQRIRKINTSGIITTIAGNGTQGYSGDGGAATAAQLHSPNGLAIDVLGNVYFADQTNSSIRKISTLGIISTVVGSGLCSYSGDGGQATAAFLCGAIGITIDNAGNIYIADTQNNRVRMVNTAGIITTIAGNGTLGYSGDGGQATAAELYEPSGIAVDASGNLYIIDWRNQRIREVNTSGIIITIAGTGTAGYSGDGGQATAAEINFPYDITFDAAGNLYIADLSNNRIRMISTLGIISTIAGNGTGGYSGDGGQATAAELYQASDIAFDATGNLYIADGDNNRIRKVTNVAASGIEAFANNNEQLTIYPNPATNSLQVSFAGTNENTELKIVNMLGEEVYATHTLRQAQGSTYTIDVSSLNGGVYTITITNSTGAVNKRVVIVH